MPARRRNTKIIQPQEGFQEKFTRSNVDVAFGGGVLNPQPLTSCVLTPKGFVKIADLRAGDEICGYGSDLQTITHWELEGEKDCVRVVLEDGSSAESALDHKWWILKDGQEMTAVSFELLESFQLAQERGVPYEVSIFRLLDGSAVPVRIKEVLDIGRKEVACIGVSNDDELYITDDYLITKNCGKAQPVDAKVLTPHGWTTMGELRDGDTICNVEGGAQTVIRVYEKGARDVYRVHFDYGSTECCAEHLWTVYDNKTAQFRTLTLHDIMEGACDRYSVACPMPVKFAAIDKPFIIEPYTLGRVLATDSLDSELLSDNMKAKLALIGITGDFFIPERYKFSSIQERMQLLRGFIDGKSEEWEIGTVKGLKLKVRETFLNDLNELVCSLGGMLSKPRRCRKSVLVNVILPQIENYYSPHMAEAGNYKVKPMRRIKSIELSRRARTRCILVSSPKHLYITDDYIPTHNTFAAILMVAEPSLDPQWRGVFTRRNLGNLKAGGGIVDDFKVAYGDYVNIKISDNPRIQFPSGAFVDCIHIADESPSKLMERIKGFQYDLAYMDELTSYEFTTFSMIGTRVRGKGAWTGKIRGTTNPKRSHWTRKMLDWYIGTDGFIMPERDGVVRYYYQTGETVDDIVWGGSPEEVYLMCKVDIDRKLDKLGGKGWSYRDMIRSFVFYAGKMSENKASVGNNSSYVGSVAAVGGRRAQQLIEGNFNVDEDEDDKAPIPSSVAQSVFNNDPCTNGDFWITADLADVGTDNLVALYWDGFHVEDIMILTNSTPRSNYERIKMFATRHDVPDSHIIYDATHGTYMYDYMPNAIPFISASSPVGLYALMSDRLKDECYLRLIDAINNNRMSFSEKVATTRYIHAGISEEYTVQTEFLEECSVVRMREKPNGRMKLLTKKEMNANLGKNRSMDLLDPCAMRMYPVLHLQYGDELDTKAAKAAFNASPGYGEVDIWSDSTWC